MFMTTPVHLPVAELTRHADEALERFQGIGPLSGYTFDRKNVSHKVMCGGQANDPRTPEVEARSGVQGHFG